MIGQNARVIRVAVRGSALVLISMLMSLAGVLAPARAADPAAEQIRSFDVAMAVQPDTTIAVTERISYQFPEGEERRGIIRDLVIADPLDDGRLWTYGVTVRSVTADGSPVPFEATEDGSLLRVRIGDPDVLVSGVVDYVIEYGVTGAMRTYAADELAGDEPYGEGDVELYWDLVGSGWEVPIAAATATVTGPQPALAYGCYAGAPGSETECPVAEDGDALRFGPVSLDIGSALTGVIAYPGAAFTAVPVPSIAEPEPTTPISTLLAIAAPIALIALALPIAIVLVSRRRLRGAELDGAPVQFGPPGDLRPAQLQAGATGEVDAAGALATLLDLVARGHITLAADDGGLLGQDRITVTWVSANPDDMSDWEQALLASILGGAEQGTLQGYNAAFAEAVKATSGQLVKEATAAGRWSADGNADWKRWLFGGMALGLLIAFSGFLFGDWTLVGFVVGIALIVGCFIASRLVPVNQTRSSAQFLAEYRGFEKLLDTDAAEARRELAQRMGLTTAAVFATMLPYAVIYGLDESWTHAFPDIEPEQLRQMGYQVGSMSALNGLVNSGRTSVDAASHEQGTGRSSGSGFSGGSAGGGGGGGGGGSW